MVYKLISRIKLIPLILLFFLLNKIHSQELFFCSSNLNLPSLETYHILQDSKGFIWITTDAGLCRLDGTTLNTYTVKDGISENVVFKSYEDKNGKIWFNTLSGYFFYYEKEKFYSIAANSQLEKICKPYPLSSFFIGNKDTLYAATPSFPGILKIPPKNNYKNILNDTSMIHFCNRFINTNNIDKNEAIMGSGGLSTNNKDSTYIVSCNNNFITTSFKGIRIFYGNEWRGVSDKEGNLYLPSGKKITLIRKVDNTIEYFDFPNEIIYINQDKEGDLWIGTRKGGGYLYKNANLKSKPIRFLRSLSISSVLLDREGSVWTSTLEKGIFQSLSKNVLCINIQGDNATTFNKKNDELTITFSSKNIMSVYKNDSIYNNRQFLNTLPNNCNLENVFIHNNKLFFSSQLGLFCLDSKNKFLLKFDNISSLKGFYKIGKDTLLIINTSAVFLFYKDEIVKKIQLPFSTMSSIQLKDKTILIYSRNNYGISEYKNGTIKTYLKEYSQLKTRINSIIEDTVGNLWIATNQNGIFCFTVKKKLLKLNNNTDLLNNKVNAFTIDDVGNLWAGTNEGLIKIMYLTNLEKITIHAFNKSNGLPTTQIEKLIAFNNKIWCASKENLFYFESSKLKLNTTAPFIEIKSIAINNKNYNLRDTPTFNYNQNNIRFQSTLISYKNLEKREFLYKLNGYDKEWHLSTTGDIQYTNLNSGVYTYSIYGLNNDKVKSKTPATFTFIIKNPFWLTWWFISILVICLILCIFTIIKFWKNKIEKREKEKTITNQKIAQLQMTAIRAQMNPHFLFNAICSIQHYIIKNNNVQSYNYLSKFSLLIRNILDNSKEDYISIEQEVTTLKLYIELEQIRFKQPFQAIIDIDKNVEMDFEIPTMLIQPYVENAIWHGLMPKKTKGCLWVLIKKDANLLKISIKDNGVGRSINTNVFSKAHESKGMLLTKERLEAMEIKYKKNFDLKITDLKDSQGNSEGTEVTITIPIDLN